MPNHHPDDVLTIPHLIASQIGAASSSHPNAVDLANAMGDVQVRTEIIGSSFITVTLIDPQYTFINQGFLKRDSNGVLSQLEVEFPVNSGMFWRLCAVDFSTDKTGANVTMTFEDRIIAILRNQWGQKTVNGVTVLQFIKALVDEASKASGVKIDFHCPALGVITDQVTSPTPQDGSRNPAKVAYITPSSKVTPALNQDQCDNINVALSLAVNSFGANKLAIRALLVGGFGASNWASNHGASTTSGGTTAPTLSTEESVFAAVLSQQTGLDLNVCKAWTLSESGGAASGNPATATNGANNWLGIGIPGGQPAIGKLAIWNDPTSAANATAQWLQGSTTVMGSYGGASDHILTIVQQKGALAQIIAIRFVGQGGWSQGGEPGLPALYDAFAGISAKAANPSEGWGVLDGSPNYFQVNDVGPEVTAFLKGGEGYSNSALYLSTHTPNDSPGTIAQKVISTSTTVSEYDAFDTQASQIIAILGFGNPNSIANTAGSVNGIPNVSGGSPGNFSRGTTQSPGEDSWDCIQRVLRSYPPTTTTTWSVFSNGNTLYVLNGWEMMHQTPVAIIDPSVNNTYHLTQGDTKPRRGDIISCSATFDNTAFYYSLSRKHSGKVQRRSRTSKPSTPSVCRLELGVGIDEIRAGTCVEIENFGPANGRWIVTDVTRNCMQDTFSSMTLEPPVESDTLLSDVSTTKSSSSSSSSSSGGGGGGGNGSNVPAAKTQLGKGGSVQTSPMSGTGWSNMFGRCSAIITSRVDQGCDWAGITGPIGAVDDGVITALGSDPGGFGLTIVQKLTNGWFVYYGMETGGTIYPTLKKGQTVSAGQQIATGNGPIGAVEFGFSSTGDAAVPITPFPAGQSHDFATDGGAGFADFISATSVGGATGAKGPKDGKIKKIIKPNPAYNPGSQTPNNPKKAPHTGANGPTGPVKG